MVVLDKNRYKSNLTAGSLKIHESRIIAGLLLSGVDNTQWKVAIFKENILKAKAPGTAGRIAGFLRCRLETMGPELWKLIRDGKGNVATHAVFAAALKHSILLGDFVLLVLGEQYRMFGKVLTSGMFEDYLKGCRERDPQMPQWSDLTIRRLQSSVFQMLAQAGYIENSRNLKLQTVHIASQVISYLETNKEDYVLRCMRVGP